MRVHKNTLLLAMVAVLVLAGLGAYGIASRYSSLFGTGSEEAPVSKVVSKNDAAEANRVSLNETQIKSVKVEHAQERVFTVLREAVGTIDFNQDMTVQVFSQYQGKIISLFAKLGDEVVKGQKLYTIDSPDLGQAESSLIAAHGVRELTTRNLARARKLFETKGISQKDLDQAISDQQSAEGAFKAARNAVRLFGKTEAEIGRIVSERKIDPVMIVQSPITGRITSRNAAPGLFVQPGLAPAPFSVADISTVWMLAFVAESDSPLFHLGQEVQVSVMAYPGRVFQGKVSTVGASVDPNTHRLPVRSEIRDPKHELRPGMLANFVIHTGDSVRGVAVPLDGIVREGDGSMSVWVTSDHHSFIRRTVEVGMQQDGSRQIIRGIEPGEMVATEGALFLSNALTNASH